MNWTTPTFHPRAQPRHMTPKAADDLPFPWPVLRRTIESTRGMSSEASWPRSESRQVLRQCLHECSTIGTKCREAGAIPALSRNCDREIDLKRGHGSKEL